VPDPAAVPAGDGRGADDGGLRRRRSHPGPGVHFINLRFVQKVFKDIFIYNLPKDKISFKKYRQDFIRHL
jgi:hypothetical protein